MLCEAARHASRPTHPLHPYFATRCAKRGYKMVTIAVAHRLARITFAMLRDGTDFFMGGTMSNPLKMLGRDDERPFRKGGGRVDAPGRRLVRAEGSSAFSILYRRPYSTRTRSPGVRSPPAHAERAEGSTSRQYT
jgi:hypothetical protein